MYTNGRSEEADLKLQRVGGEEVTFLTDDDGVYQDVLLETPGIYILKDSTGRELRRLAANLPTAESDLSALPRDGSGATDCCAMKKRAARFWRQDCSVIRRAARNFGECC